MEQCHDIGDEQLQNIDAMAAIRGICHVTCQGQSSVYKSAYKHQNVLTTLLGSPLAQVAISVQTLVGR